MFRFVLYWLGNLEKEVVNHTEDEYDVAADAKEEIQDSRENHTTRANPIQKNQNKITDEPKTSENAIAVTVTRLEKQVNELTMKLARLEGQVRAGEDALINLTKELISQLNEIKIAIGLATMPPPNFGIPNSGPNPNQPMRLQPLPLYLPLPTPTHFASQNQNQGNGNTRFWGQVAARNNNYRPRR